MKTLESLYARTAAPWSTTININVDEDRGQPTSISLEISSGSSTASHYLTHEAAQALAEALFRVTNKHTKPSSLYYNPEISIMNGIEQIRPAAYEDGDKGEEIGEGC